MHDESSITFETACPRNGVLSLSGYGIRVTVERGYLTVEDGRGKDRRRARFSRTTRDLKRLVIFGHTGSISFDALRWLHDIGCAFVQLDIDGTVLTASGPTGSDDARLRRAQALASGNATGLEIVRNLLTEKLDGQARALQSIDGADSASGEIRRLADTFATCETLAQFRTIEAQAASIYWSAWTNVRVHFARKAASRMPDHWQCFGSRTSPFTGSPRIASNPPNAILNYLYAITEAECRIALLRVGLDPGIGIVHADQRNRDSLACDVMEAVRPAVDTFLLNLLETHPFGLHDIFETRQGACRLMPPVTRMLIETAPQWAATIGPVVENIAQALMSGNGIARTMPTPLTQTNRSAGRVQARASHRTATHARASSGSSARVSTGESRRVATLPAACHDCGVVLTNPKRKYCDSCIPDVRREQGTGAFALSGPVALAAQRVAGNDPAHGGDAGKARGQRNAAHIAAVGQWEREHNATSEPEYFIRDILPILQEVPLRAMAEATGLTEGYCSFVRRGLKIPHRRHWARLSQIGLEEPS